MYFPALAALRTCYQKFQRPLWRFSMLLTGSLLTVTSWAQGAQDLANLSPDSTPGRLTWVEVPAPDSLITTSQAVLSLRAVSESAEPLLARVRWSADDGNGNQWTGNLEERLVRPGAETSWKIDLQEAGVTADPHFAGRVLAGINWLPEGATSVLDPGVVRAYAPEVYFHRDAAGGHLFYGEQVLRDRFHSGDLTGITPPVRFGRVERVTGAGNNGRPVDPQGPEVLSNDGRRLCVQWQVRVTDGGHLVQNTEGDWITEDYWVNTLKPGDKVPPGYDPDRFNVIARGVRVTLIDGKWSKTYDADPTSGCFTFRGDFSKEITAYVATYSTDADGNVVTVGSEWLEESFWPFLFARQIEPPSPGQELTLFVGDYTPRATMGAISAFTSYRKHFSLKNKEIRLRESEVCKTAKGAESSAHFKNSQISEGIAHVRIHNGSGTTSDGKESCSGADMRRWKFLIGHEMGHAWLLLATGKNHYESWANDLLCDTSETQCKDTGPGYAIGSLEWGSVALREGIAHFYASRVWNRPDTHGVFTWLGKTAYDVELDDQAPIGGRLYGTCDTKLSRCGRGTILDWLRFFWDWHTPLSNSKPTMSLLRDIYVRNALGHFEGGLKITKSNSYFRLREAMLQEVSSPTLRTEWDTFALLNGVNTSTTEDACSFEEDLYPQCSCWSDRCSPMPDACLGEPDCPCADVDLFGITPQDLGLDGTYPDGEGSYATHGLDTGPGQFCSDSEGVAVCGLRTVLDQTIPTCDRCGIDTFFGCSCNADQDCEGLDDEPLSCWRAPSVGWAGNGPGICLPSIDNGKEEKNYDRLTELPWFCLENCAAKGSSYRCAYDQLQVIPPGNIELKHATCVDTDCDLEVGSCEAQGKLCHTDGPNGDYCGDQCLAKDPTENKIYTCSTWGFPEHFACDDADDAEPGHCVPEDCANQKGPFFEEHGKYCQLFW